MITGKQAVNELFDKDLPAALAAAIEEAENNGRADIANDLRCRRICIDTFEIDLLDEAMGKPTSRASTDN